MYQKLQQISFTIECFVADVCGIQPAGRRKVAKSAFTNKVNKCFTRASE